MSEQVAQNQPIVSASQAPTTPEATAPITPTEPEVYKKAEVEAIIESRYKTIQRTLSQKDREIQDLRKSLEQFRTQPVTDITSTLEVLKKQANGDPVILADIALIENKENLKRQRVEWEAQMAKIEATGRDEEGKIRQRIIDAGGDPDDTKFDRIWVEHSIAVKSGSAFDKVHDLLDKRLGVTPASGSPATKKKETEAELAARIEREVLERHGLLQGEKVLPSNQGGGSGVFSRKQLADMSPEDYKANHAKIQEAYRQNRIK